MTGYEYKRNRDCRISDWVFRGLRMAVLENGFLRVSVLADKGSDICEFLNKPNDINIM